MTLWVLKLVITPLLIATATLITRRWGPVVGGWIVGLPLTSGPVSVFLALEQGRAFAGSAARSALWGTVAIAVFSLGYAHAARKKNWPSATAVALGLYFAAIAVFSRVRLSLGATTALVIVFVAACLLAVGRTRVEMSAHTPPKWDLPFRMVAATVMVLVITGVSAILGPVLSGLFASFPVFTCVMSAFSHSLYGSTAVRAFSRGIIGGCFAAGAFFLVIALTVEDMPLVVVYSSAVLVAGGVNLAVLKGLTRRSLSERS